MSRPTWVDLPLSPSLCMHISSKVHRDEQIIWQRTSWYVLSPHISKILFLSEHSASTGTSRIGSSGKHVWIIARSTHHWGRCPDVWPLGMSTWFATFFAACKLDVAICCSCQWGCMGYGYCWVSSRWEWRICIIIPRYHLQDGPPPFHWKNRVMYSKYIRKLHKFIYRPSAQPVPMSSTFGRVWHLQVWIQQHFRMFLKTSSPCIIYFNASSGKIASKTWQPLAKWKDRFPLICQIVISHLGGMDYQQQKSHSLPTSTLMDFWPRQQEPLCFIAKITRSTIMSEFLTETGVIIGNDIY